MNNRLLNKHYRKLSREELIKLLISSRNEIYELKQNQELIDNARLRKRIRFAIRYIDMYTQSRKYITENDKNLLEILEGKYDRRKRIL